MMAASLRKADVLFAVSALSEGYFDYNEERSISWKAGTKWKLTQNMKMVCAEFQEF